MILRVLSLAALLSAPALAADSPLTVSAVSSEGGKLRFTVTNQAQQPVAGYIVRCIPAASGALRTTHAQMTNGVIPSGGRAPYAPGESWTATVRQPEPAPGAAVEISFILFADGSSWGDASRPEAAAMRGMRQGAEAERQALRRLLDRDGAEAVRQALAAQP